MKHRWLAESASTNRIANPQWHDLCRAHRMTFGSAAAWIKKSRSSAQVRILSIKDRRS